ncbi:MAG TPA: hypothetical protein DIC51_04270 [Coxiellaceae bacterium]|nr:hypothetical protein [Coxiellaceae bacterium]
MKKIRQSKVITRLTQNNESANLLMQCVFHNVSSGIVITDKNATIVDVNMAFTKITGYSRKEIIGQNPRILHSDYQEANFYKKMWKNLLEQGYWQGSIWDRRKDNSVYPELLTIQRILDDVKQDYYFIGIFSEITLFKEKTTTLNLAYYDPLTHLPNRQLLLAHLDNLFNLSNRQSGRKDFEIHCFFIDLDRFKPVNDTYGHLVGDKLLIQVVERIQSCIRKADFMARIGGDEFIIITVSNAEFNVNQFCDKITRQLNKKFVIDHHKIRISVSIGISYYTRNSRSIEKLIKKADKAMYQAKATNQAYILAE